MPEAAQSLFEKGVEQQAETLISLLEKQGIPVPERDLKKEWVKDKIRKGFTTLNIAQILRANNFDFEAAGKYMDNIYAAQHKSEEAIRGVTEIKEKTETDEIIKKRTAQLTWIISAFVTAGVGLFLAIFLKMQTKDLGSIGGSEIEMATSMMDQFVKGGWIIAIAGFIVGLFLTVMTLAAHFKEKARRRKQPESIEVQRKEIEEKLKKAQSEADAAKAAAAAAQNPQHQTSAQTP